MNSGNHNRQGARSSVGSRVGISVCSVYPLLLFVLCPIVRSIAQNPRVNPRSGLFRTACSRQPASSRSFTPFNLCDALLSCPSARVFPISPTSLVRQIVSLGFERIRHGNVIVLSVRPSCGPVINLLLCDEDQSSNLCSTGFHMEGFHMKTEWRSYPSGILGQISLVFLG